MCFEEKSSSCSLQAHLPTHWSHWYFKPQQALAESIFKWGDFRGKPERDRSKQRERKHCLKQTVNNLPSPTTGSYRWRLGWALKLLTASLRSQPGLPRIIPSALKTSKSLCQPRSNGRKMPEMGLVLFLSSPSTA